MTRDPRPYNGLHLPNGAQAVSQGEQLKRAIAMEMQALTREIYVRAAAAQVGHVEYCEDGGLDAAKDFRVMARDSQIAARQFFIGLGVIEEETEEQPAE